MNDPRVMRLPDSVFRRWIELSCLASEQTPRDGRLPPVADAAWRLHVSPEDLETDLTDLANAGLADHRGGIWHLSHFEAEQSPIADKDRARAYRERKHHGSVTGRDTESESDRESESEGEGESDGLLRDSLTDLGVTHPDRLLATYDAERVRDVYDHCRLRGKGPAALIAMLRDGDEVPFRDLDQSRDSVRRRYTQGLPA